MKYFWQARCESQKCLWNMRAVWMETGKQGEKGGAWLAWQGDSSGPSICRLLFELSFPCFCPKRARELLQFMQFFPHKHTCIYIFMYVYVYMYMYWSLFTNVCVCTYYMAIRWEEYFFKLLSKLLFHFMICNSLSLCVRVCLRVGVHVVSNRAECPFLFAFAYGA